MSPSRPARESGFPTADVLWMQQEKGQKTSRLGSLRGLTEGTMLRR